MMINFEHAEIASEPGIKLVRECVFIKEQNVPVELEWDNEDQAAHHIIAREENGQVVATARLLANGHIGRMAVLLTYRSQGIGSKLLRCLMDEAKASGLKKVFLNAQTSAVDFYLRFGFMRVGKEFMDAGIPHYRMQKDL